VGRLRAVASAQGQRGARRQYQRQIGRKASTCPGVCNLYLGTLLRK